MPPRDYYLPQRRLVSQQDAAIIEAALVPRSRFVGTKTRKTTFDAGQLIPFHLDEVLPGDHISYRVTAMVRMGTPLFPMFDNMRIDTFAFFCPNRLVWTNWMKFMGEQANPGDSIAFTIPQVVSPASGFAVTSLHDYFGLPTVGQLTAGQTITVNNLPGRIYNLVYNTWFRDENLINSAVVDVDDGPDTLADYTVRARAKSHDYFTSCLPAPQKFTAPTIALGGLAPIQGLAVPQAATGADDGSVKETARGSVTYNDAFSSASTTFYIDTDGTATLPKVYADLSLATGISINDLRQAFLVQQLLERDARGGTRYVELIKSHFGVTVPDYRLLRPEYIGGGQSPLVVTPIAQTAPTTGVPLGALGGAATAAGQHSASYAATEHGYIIWIINVRSELSYQQGIPRHFKRSVRTDFYFPSLADLGEQAVYRQEIYALGTSDDTLVFGYQERWHEYRTMVSDVTGVFRSTAAGTIDGWHLAQRFTAAPTLGGTFITDTPPMSRVLAAGASTGQQFLADIQIERTAVRPMPTYGTPALLGRF